MFEYILGFIIGFMTTLALLKIVIVGNLKIDCSESTTKPFMFLELHKPPLNIYHRRYIVLEVHHCSTRK